jgi:tetratricopeptide (TPR) repeat protein
MNLDQINKFIEEENYEKAVLMLDLMLAEDIDNQEALYLQLSLLVFLGQSEKALEYADKYLEIRKDSSVMQIKATILMLNAEVKAALNLANEIIAMEPENIEAKLLRINAMFMQEPESEESFAELKSLYLEDTADRAVLFYYLLYLKEFGYTEEFELKLAEFAEYESEMAEMIKSSTLQNAISGLISLQLAS